IAWLRRPTEDARRSTRPKNRNSYPENPGRSPPNEGLASFTLPFIQITVAAYPPVTGSRRIPDGVGIKMG
nr:hypothetical protein [Micromonospora sp. DSM 115978]